MDEQSVEQLYDVFSLKSWDLPEVMDSFVTLKKKLNVQKLHGLELYKELKSLLSKVWKAKEVLCLLDKKANQKEYMGQKAAKDICVLIIGAGPVGLRLAMECILLGAEVIVVEKRTTFSRNNVLHLWPFTIEDLRQLGAKKFYGKFCAGAIDHVSIRSLQCILLKICLLLGVRLYYDVEFLDVLEPENGLGWHAKVKPGEHPVSKFEFDFIVDAGGARQIRIPCFDRKELRGKLALAITANFKNYGTSQEAAVDEISGVAFIFNQKFFKELNEETGIDLENIVYYKDDTHYFVMTAKKESLLKKGVLKADYPDVKDLLNRNNIDEENLCKYSTEAASWSTDLPNLDFEYNHHNKRDVALFDFTSIHQTEHAAKAIKRGGKILYLCLAGDALLEPFWPQGTGCARGFLSAMDTAWLIRGVGQKLPVMDLLCEREIIFQRLPQTTPQKLQKNIEAFTIDPRTRYRNLNLARKLRPEVMQRLYMRDDNVPSALTAPGEIMVNEETVLQSRGESEGKVPIVPARSKKNKSKGSSSVDHKPLLEKGTVHRAYYVNIDDFNTLKNHRDLKLWLKKQVKPYDIKVIDLSSSWSNGMALCALIHHYRPDLIPSLKSLSPENSVENNELAFSVAEKHLGISSLIKPTEMEKPDRLALVTYLSLFYELFQDSQPFKQRADTGNELEVSTKHVPVKAADKTRPSSSKISESSAKGPSAENPVDTVEMLIASQMPVNSFAVQNTSKTEVAAATATTDKASKPPEKSNEKREKSQKKKDKSDKKVGTSDKKTDKPSKQSGNLDKKANESDKKADKLNKWSNVSGKEAGTTEKQSDKPGKISGKSEKLAASADKEANLADKRLTSADKCTKTLEASPNNNVANTEDQIMSPVESSDKKKKKRKFHLFRRNKIKSLATTTPSIERRWTTKERPKYGGRKKKASDVEVASPQEKGSPCDASSTTPKSTKSRLSEGYQFKASPLNSSDFCYFCGKRVYVMERMSANGCFFHRNCFRCTHCNCQLQMGNYTLSKGEGGEKGKFFCLPHYRQLFISHPEVINYSRANASKKQAEITSDKPAQEEKTASTKKPDSAEHKEVIFSSGGEVSKSKSKKSKKKCKDIPEPLIASPSDCAKSPDPSESPKTPKSGKSGWFRRRTSSDSKALKSKSAQSSIKSTPVSPGNPEQPQTASKSSSPTGSGTKGMVKMLSAHFESLDKQPDIQPVTEGRPRTTGLKFQQQLSSIREDSTTKELGRSASMSSSSGPPIISGKQSVPVVQQTRRTPNRGQKNLTRRVVSSYSTSDVAIREYRKQQERFTEAQIIQREMSQLEMQREELEEDGRRIENDLRDIEDAAQEEELMGQWLSLINERNGLERLTAELTLKMKELGLEDRQYEIEKELNELLQISPDEQTSEERERFEFLCEEKVKVVLERNEIVDQLEEERVQHQKDEATDAGYDDDYEETQISSSETSDDESDIQEEP